MTTTFDKREQAFEKKFAQDEELRFKANARRNRLIGAWAANKLGLKGNEAEAYAKSLVLVDLDSPGSSSVLARISADFDANGIGQFNDEITAMMDAFMKQALAELEAGK